MNAYLTRLGIRPEIQEWLLPYYHTDVTGNLCFSYGDDYEVYGLAFHRVPLTTGCWLTGSDHLPLMRQVFICSSAMEAISWLNCHFTCFGMIENLLFLAIGSKLAESQFNRIRHALPGRKYRLLFGNDLLGRICDLKAATLLIGNPAEIALEGDELQINFRDKCFRIPCKGFSLNAFERISGFRFNVSTHKPGQHSSWFSQLQAQTLNQ